VFYLLLTPGQAQVIAFHYDGTPISARFIAGAIAALTEKPVS